MVGFVTMCQVVGMVLGSPHRSASQRATSTRSAETPPAADALVAVGRRFLEAKSYPEARKYVRRPWRLPRRCPQRRGVVLRGICERQDDSRVHQVVRGSGTRGRTARASASRVTVGNEEVQR
jgi:hypothetical protein